MTPGLHDPASVDPTTERLDSLLAESRHLLLAFIEGLGVAPGRAEDVLQHSLLKALRAAPDLRDDERLVPWFYRIVRNAVYDSHRRRARERRAMTHLAAEHDPVVSPREATLLCLCFRALLPALKPEYRVLIEEIELEGRDPGGGTLGAWPAASVSPATTSTSAATAPASNSASVSRPSARPAPTTTTPTAPAHPPDGPRRRPSPHSPTRPLGHGDPAPDLDVPPDQPDAPSDRRGGRSSCGQPLRWRLPTGWPHPTSEIILAFSYPVLPRDALAPPPRSPTVGRRRPARWPRRPRSVLPPTVGNSQRSVTTGHGSGEDGEGFCRGTSAPASCPHSLASPVPAGFVWASSSPSPPSASGSSPGSGPALPLARWAVA